MTDARGSSVVPLPLDRIRDIMRDLVEGSTVSIQSILPEARLKARGVARGASGGFVPDQGGGRGVPPDASQTPPDGPPDLVGLPPAPATAVVLGLLEAV